MSLPDLRKPTWVRPGVVDIDFVELSRMGRTAVFLDVDNTICGLHDAELNPDCVRVLQSARDAGHIRHLCLVSNTGFWWRAHRVRGFAATLGALAVCAAWYDLKPSAGPFRQALDLVGVDVASAVMVGDQVFTDIVGANRVGLMSILVTPLGPDGWSTRLSGRRRREAALRQTWS